MTVPADSRSRKGQNITIQIEEANDPSPTPSSHDVSPYAKCFEACAIEHKRLLALMNELTAQHNLWKENRQMTSKLVQKVSEPDLLVPLTHYSRQISPFKLRTTPSADGYSSERDAQFGRRTTPSDGLLLPSHTFGRRTTPSDLFLPPRSPRPSRLQTRLLHDHLTRNYSGTDDPIVSPVSSLRKCFPRDRANTFAEYHSGLQVDASDGTSDLPKPSVSFDRTKAGTEAAIVENAEKLEKVLRVGPRRTRSLESFTDTTKTITEEAPQAAHSSEGSTSSVVKFSSEVETKDYRIGSKDSAGVQPLRRNSSGPRLSLDKYEEQRRQDALQFTSDNRNMSFTSSGVPRAVGVRGKLDSLVSSNKFEFFFAVAVLQNSLLIGSEAEWAGRYRGQESPRVFDILGLGYTIVFLLELLMRILAKGKRFFYRSPNVYWNYFDLFVVSTSVLESSLTFVMLYLTDSQELAGGFDQIRIARLIRVARLLRFVRVARITRFVLALRTLVSSIVGVLKSLFWSIILLELVIYTFAIVFAQAATGELISSDLTELQSLYLAQYWGTVLASMLTLFMALTGGVSWEIPARTLSDINSVWLMLFLLFMVFTYFAVLNVIIAVFVQNAMDGAKTDQDMIVQMNIKQKNAYIELVKRLFRKIDKTNSGAINLAQLQDVFDDLEVQAYFESLELQATSAWSLFKILDADEGNSIDMEEFVQGCLQQRGGARQLELAEMRKDTNYLMIQLDEFMCCVEDQLCELCDKLVHDDCTEI